MKPRLLWPSLPRHWTAAAPVALLLAACSSGPTTMDSPATAFGGTWVVTDSFPAGGVTDMGSSPLGQMVRMDAAMAGDVAGRACPWPSYGDSKGVLGSVVGAITSPLPQSLESPVGVLEVTCAGQRFATYAVLADGSMLTRHGPWLLRLEHGEKLAARPAPMAPEPSMAPEAHMAPVAHMAIAAPAIAMDPPAAPAAPPKLVYLASYKTEAWAKKGWGILAAQSASLKALQPVTHAVDLKGKGKFIRLFAPAADEAAGKRICHELGKAISDCGASGREK
ncbi:hypothetical protein CU669_02735 [Paramagnetospirillum kuznetsovii]|uniref:SPOR domain-containing protein n=1 Tax=Paramagnetospirillum kuznetsovii TaxID=2053833 RepID=A0A364P174_9PROT|nr:hypothetical protein [Paramagnetospirillum kuznetsovii]RAU23098.1 hypothetical protein CU669_02735 [Paramagnetospirillum kuznetsovii]